MRDELFVVVWGIVVSMCCALNMIALHQYSDDIQRLERRITESESITMKRAHCEMNGHWWPVREDGSCYVEDMPKREREK